MSKSRLRHGWVLVDGQWFKPCHGCSNKLLPLDSFYQRKGYNSPTALCKSCHVKKTNKYHKQRVKYMRWE